MGRSGSCNHQYEALTLVVITPNVRHAFGPPNRHQAAPDVTRLLDRLEDAGLIERERSTEDRRQVGTRITARGIQLLSELDAPVAEIHRRQLGHLSALQLRTLAELLTLARQRP